MEAVNGPQRRIETSHFSTRTHTSRYAAHPTTVGLVALGHSAGRPSVWKVRYLSRNTQSHVGGIQASNKNRKNAPTDSLKYTISGWELSTSASSVLKYSQFHITEVKFFRFCEQPSDLLGLLYLSREQGVYMQCLAFNYLFHRFSKIRWESDPEEVSWIKLIKPEIKMKPP